MLKDSSHTYGLISRIFHWVMALLIGLQFLKLGDRINDGEHWVGQTLVPWHITTGVLLLTLILPRIFWALSQKGHRPLHHGATALLIKGGHFLLYGTMLLMPITGILYMLGNGYGLKILGTRVVERGPEIDWALAVGSFHSPIAWLLIVLVTGHILAAIYHYITRDGIMKSL